MKNKRTVLRHIRLGVCMKCFFDQEDALRLGEGPPAICERQKLPRRKRKAVNMLRRLSLVFGRDMFHPMSRCDVADFYKEPRNKVLLSRVRYWVEYRREILLLLMFCDEMGDSELDFDHSGVLGFTWEDDNGLYCTSGITELQFRQVDRYWMFSELQSIMEHLFGFGLLPDTVSDEKGLLLLIRRLITEKRLSPEYDDLWRSVCQKARF